jgi:hypothetical protein
MQRANLSEALFSYPCLFVSICGPNEPFQFQASSSNKNPPNLQASSADAPQSTNRFTESKADNSALFASWHQAQKW